MGDTHGREERREHPRADVQLPARVHAGGETVPATSVNLSTGGMLLVGADLPSADQVRVEIELAELGWHSLDAEVVRRDAGDGATSQLAARFAQVATEGGRAAIRAFFETHLRAGAPPRDA